MSHFYSTTRGHRSQVSRTGTKVSGMHTTCNGWDIGASIIASYSSELDSDIINVIITGGSNNSRTKGQLSFTVVNGKLKILQTDFPELLV